MGVDYAAAMIETSRAAQERKAFKGPEAWSKQQMVDWVAQLDGGKYASLAPSFQITGKMYAVEWVGVHHNRVEAAGGTREDSEAIYDAFHAELKKAKDAARKKQAGGRGGGTLSSRLRGGKKGGVVGRLGGIPPRRSAHGEDDGSTSLFPTGQKPPPGAVAGGVVANYIGGSGECAESNTAAEKANAAAEKKASC